MANGRLRLTLEWVYGASDDEEVEIKASWDLGSKAGRWPINSDLLASIKGAVKEAKP